MSLFVSVTSEPITDEILLSSLLVPLSIKMFIFPSQPSLSFLYFFFYFLNFSR